MATKVKNTYCPDCGGILEKLPTHYPQGLEIKVVCSKCDARWEIQYNFTYYPDGITEIRRIK